MKVKVNQFKILSAILLLIPLFLSSCSSHFRRQELDKKYGPSDSNNRIGKHERQHTFEYFKDIKPILDNRCVVCHACYDAPCQLKLGSYDGIERGANKTLVYDGTRLFTATPSRLYIDQTNTSEWRKENFFPVINERAQTSFANIEGSMLYQMLIMREEHSLPKDTILPKTFDFGPNRSQQCPTIEEFPSFKSKYPLWSMPFGLPSLKDHEIETLKTWIAEGSYSKGIPPVSKEFDIEISKWENFLNGISYKEKLMSRYLYEHLFLAHLHFENVNELEFFRVVRSKTPSGEPVETIPSRRPYDDPETEKFYYRIVRDESSVTHKNHLPYALNNKRMNRYKELFLDIEYQIRELPSYKPEISTNPFVAFADIPVRSRYQFLLDEAKFFIMSFIKGPVCRGQVALNVIEDHFWIFFLEPDHPDIELEKDFLKNQKEYLRLPTEEDRNLLSAWLEYSKLQRKHLSEKRAFLKNSNPEARHINDYIWDGDKENPNAALTIFRHFDSAAVVEGFVGNDPKTAWLLSYPLFERIYYLLVAGFDVYGNLKHQALVRLYMDFLRMEGEYNFLSLLPPDVRKKERDFWYRDAESLVKEYISWANDEDNFTSLEFYKSENPKHELFNIVKNNLGNALSERFNFQSLKEEELVTSLQKMNQLQGKNLSHLPEFAIIRLSEKNGKKHLLSLIHNSGMSNVFSPFFENSRRIPEEDTVTVTNGLAGSYPNIFFDLTEDNMNLFIDRLSKLTSEDDYYSLLNEYGVRRTNPAFWEFSDWVHRYFKNSHPVEAGLMDLNRIENR